MSGLLLDTNVLIRILASDRDSIAARAVDAIEDPDNSLFLSAVSIWEIAIKRSLGKLRAPDDWFEAVTRMDVMALAVTFRHAREVEDLPQVHRDPFDRLLIAQAKVEDLKMVTSDNTFSAYDVDVLW